MPAGEKSEINDKNIFITFQVVIIWASININSLMQLHFLQHDFINCIVVVYIPRNGVEYLREHFLIQGVVLSGEFSTSQAKKGTGEKLKSLFSYWA